MVEADSGQLDPRGDLLADDVAFLLAVGSAEDCRCRNGSLASAKPE
jgi:hypothetical protein